jgi:hypothetical protein
MIIQESTSYKVQVKNILNKMKGINKWRYDFMIEVFGLFLSIKGRINFLQLNRFGNHGEQHYRNQFESHFDFMSFNKALIDEHASKQLTIAFDPSYISKSGKATPGVGWYWSGCAGKSKWGLEMGGIAAIDIETRTAFHLEAVQTPNDLKSTTLLDHYASVLVERKQSLLSVSKYLVADAYFSKQPFVSKLCEHGFHVVSRLRDDAYLQYLYSGKTKLGRGRPQLYDGKIDYNNLNTEYFETIEENEVCKIYKAIVHSKSLKRSINLVIVYTLKKGKWSHKLYFCTDLNLSAELLLEYYQTRFQIEFIYRDAKQFTGLNDCQARSENKLHFHFNAALTSINLAKISHWLPSSKQEQKPFSMSSVKTMNHNELLLNQFFSVFAISPNKQKNKTKVRKLLRYGTIAA